MLTTTAVWRYVRVCIGVCLIFLCLPVAARAEVVSLDTRLTVFENASFDVAERIVYDFGTEKRHGLFRIVPYSYQAGKTTYTAHISALTVSDDQGNPVPFVESLDNSQLNVKIGDPTSEVVGQRTYVLTYHVDGPFLYWDDGDELYWNVSGAWTTQVKHVSVLVDMPVGAHVLRASCFVGSTGSTSPCLSNEELVSAERAGYHARAEHLAPGEALVVSVLFPKGVIAEYQKPWQRSSGFADRRGLLLFPGALLAVLLIWWWVRGRASSRRFGAGVTVVPPEPASLLVTAFVCREHIGGADVVAELIRLAELGYVCVRETSVGAYTLMRTDVEAPPGSLEAAMLDVIVPRVRVGDEAGSGTEPGAVPLLEHPLVHDGTRRTLTQLVTERTLADKYMFMHPKRLRVAAVGLGVLCAGAGLALLWYDPLQDTNLVYGVVGMLCGAVLVFGNRLLSPRTSRGVRLCEHAEAYRTFLDTDESEGNTVRAALELTAHVRAVHLPYAVMFGVESGWLALFANTVDEAPRWFSCDSADALVRDSFAQCIVRVADHARDTAHRTEP